MKDKNLVISIHTILITLLVIFCLWVLYLLRDIFIILFISMILALALEPIVDILVYKKVPRGLAVIAVVIFVLAIFGVLASVAVTPLIQQTQILINRLPQYIDAFLNLQGMENYANQINNSLFDQLGQSTKGVIQATIGAFSGALAVIVIIVFMIYILLDFNNLRNNFLKFFHPMDRKKVQKTVREIELRLGGWLRGQLILMMIIGAATFIGLTALKIEYALALAVLAGLLEVVPIIGPIIALIPAVIIGFVVAPTTGLGVLGLYILIQQAENHFIVPKVMQKAVGFNPLITIIALLVGAKVLGLIGAILAIPFTIVFAEVAKYLLDRK